MSALGKLHFYGSFMGASIHIIIPELNTTSSATAICISNDFDKIKIGNIKPHLRRMKWVTLNELDKRFVD